MSADVAVVGTGAVTTLAFGVRATLEGLAAGEAVRGEARIPPPYLRREVPRSLESQVKFLNGAGRLCVEAVGEAWGASGWADAGVEGPRKGLFLSQMDAWDWACEELRTGFDEATEGFRHPAAGEALNREVARRTKPFFLLESLKNNAFSFLSNLHDLKGANTSVGGWSGASLFALDMASRAVARGDLDRALVVGAGRATHPVAQADLLRHGLAREGGDGTFRPFERGGTGEVLGEGVAAMALERASDARAGGRLVLGLVAGHGASVGPTHDPLPVPCAAAYADALIAALETAGAPRPAFVVLPAFGLPEADAEILRGLAAVEALEGIPAVSWRGALGNTPLASELVDVVLALEALRVGVVPPTAGLVRPLDGAEVVRREPFAPERPGALVLTAGLTGNTAAVLVVAG